MQIKIFRKRIQSIFEKFVEILQMLSVRLNTNLIFGGVINSYKLKTNEFFSPSTPARMQVFKLVVCLS